MAEQIDLTTITLHSGGHDSPESGHCECGCGQLAPIATRTNVRAGQVKGRPLRFISGHNRRGTTNLRNYAVQPNGCWLWLGSKNRKGYGRAQVNGEHTGAHRAVYESIYGLLPADVHIDHRCRNHACVNPDHLAPRDPRANSADTSRRRLTVEQAVSVLASSESSTAIARRYSVSRQAISDIRCGHRWPSAHDLYDKMIRVTEPSAALEVVSVTGEVL